VRSCANPNLFGAATCTLDKGNVSADTTVYSGLPDNFGNGFEMCVGGTQRAVVRFNLSVIPAGMTIDTASFGVTVGRVANGIVPSSASVFRVTGPSGWTEAAPTYPVSATRTCTTTNDQTMSRSNGHALGVGS